MQRVELFLTDQQIIGYVEQNWEFKVAEINYLDTGQAFAFRLTNKSAKKVFLKITQKTDDFAEFYLNLWSYRQIIAALEKPIPSHEFLCIPEIICTKRQTHFHELNNYIFVLYEFVEGIHPASEKDLDHRKLALLFKQLHDLPIEQFAWLPTENFDIDYALGIEKLLVFIGDGNIMQQKLSSNRKQLCRALSILINSKKKFEKAEFKYVLTHGDAHCYNILQANSKLTLIDWENLKLAPVERDLWHYTNHPLLTKAYCELNPNITVNYELCLFYKIQRFLEDARFYLEQSNISEDQQKENNNNFLDHWGWKSRFDM